MVQQDSISPVIVAGAGPTGMSAALALQARGVPVRILEADPEDRDRPGSRAVYVHGATLQTLERIKPGLGEQLADAGLTWDTRRTLWKGKEVFSRTYSDASKSPGLPHFTALPQVRTERFMLDALEDESIPIQWNSPVTTVRPSNDGVHVETEDGNEYETPYVVGADGAGSDVRDEIGATFDGSQSENSFIIADVEEIPDNPRPKERIFHWNHPKVGGRNVLLAPFTGGWRVDIQCKKSDSPERFTQDDVIADLTGRLLDERYADRVTWVSSYQFKQVIADTFIDKDRRVLLAGEAAHLFAPFGARGMNSGIADADKAASAISVALQAQTDAVAQQEIEAYAAQREKAGQWNMEAAGQALENQQGENPFIMGKKFLASKLADYWEPAGEWLDKAPYGPTESPPIATGSKY